MPRAPEAWKIKEDPRTGLYAVRFRIAGVRIQRGTGERTRTRAALAAERLYTEALTDAARPPNRPTDSTPPTGTVRGSTLARVEPSSSVATTSRAGTRRLGPIDTDELDRALDRWRDAIASELDERTTATYRAYGKAHWRPHFGSLERIDDRSCEALVRRRLTQVLRRTVLKENSALRGFLEWAHREGLVGTVPTVPTPGRRAAGVEHDSGKRRKVRVDLTPSEVEAILAALPERTRHGLPARAFLTFMYETSLRYGTVAGLSAPHDYRPGAATVLVRGVNDKARYERAVPLSTRARAALDSVCPQSGLIFGPMRLYGALQHAARDAGLEPFRAQHLGYHSLRHARLTHLGEQTTNLAAIAYLAGHKHVSTTSLYVHGGLRAASALIESLDEDD